MVSESNGYFLLSTRSTSLVLSTKFSSHLTLAYYGPRIKSLEEVPSLDVKINFPKGHSVLSSSYSLDALPLMVSTPGRGDYFSPSVVLSSSLGSVYDFRYSRFETLKEIPSSPFPVPHGANEELVLHLLDEKMGAELELHFLVYEESDTLGSYIKINNLSQRELTIHKCASLQLPLLNRDDTFLSLYGNWSNEFSLEEKPLVHGRIENDSLSGASGARHNPLCLLREKGATLNDGSVYSFNLVYSGNHLESVELDSYDDLRLQVGLSSFMLEKKVAPGESFLTPVATLTYSSKGLNGVMDNNHSFVAKSVIRSSFSSKIRPLCYNNWEATSFGFTKGKIVSLMKKAASLGMECFVLDDGWFGARNDDSHGLGDWECNEKKLPGGLKALSGEAAKLGLKFGIWMEPEMVNDDSEVFKEHPDYIIRDNVHSPLRGRNQYSLDLRKKEVQDFVFGAVSNTLESADISYLKWDYNRPMSDFPDFVGNFSYDYILGLYKVLTRLIGKFPDVLFENCASGSSRFDLGMLSFFPQSWLSDDTDSYERERIQAGALLGYPQSVMSNHVSAKTSNQVLRLTSLDAKFDVAAFGVLGYELDLNDLTSLDEKIIKGQVEFYKSHRELCQFGRIYFVQDRTSYDPYVLEATNGKEAVVGTFKGLEKPGNKVSSLRAYGLEDGVYEYSTRVESISLKKFGNLVNYISPIHLKEDGALIDILSRHKDMKSEEDKGLISSSALKGPGAVLSEEWSGLGYNEKTRLLGDFGARLYYLKKKE